MYGGTNCNFYFCSIDGGTGVLYHHAQSVSEEQQTLGGVAHSNFNDTASRNTGIFDAGQLARVTIRTDKFLRKTAFERSFLRAKNERKFTTAKKICREIKEILL